MDTKRCLILLGALMGIAPSYLGATEWYVRPATGIYGSQTGSTYKDAWAGLASIRWGDAGVQAGDTLYVCGVHYEWDGLYVGASGRAGSPITISGNCPGDPGTIWAALRIQSSDWKRTDGGLYAVPWEKNEVPYSAAGLPGQEKLLRIASSLVECSAKEDSVFLDQDNSLLYYNPAGSPQQVMTFWGNSAVRLLGNDYVTLTGTAGNRFKLRGGRCCNWGTITVANGDSGDGPATNVVIQHVDIAFSAFTGIRTGVGSHDMLVQDNVFHNLANGIYSILNVGDVPSVDRTRILRNEFFSGSENAQYTIFRNQIADNHAIGMMSGDDIEVSENYIHDWRGLGINLYLTGDYTMRRFRVTRNRIENLVGEDTEYTSAILVNGSSSSDFGRRMDGGVISHNVIVGCPVGYPMGKYGYGGAFRIKSGFSDEPMIIAHNTVQDCHFGLYHRNTSPEGEMGFWFVNNVIDQPRDGGFYYYIESSPNQKVVKLDGNFFAGHATGMGFRLGIETYTLAGWQGNREMSLPDSDSKEFSESPLTPLMTLTTTASMSANLVPVPSHLHYCIDSASVWPTSVRLVKASEGVVRLGPGAFCVNSTPDPSQPRAPEDVTVVQRILRTFFGGSSVDPQDAAS